MATNPSSERILPVEFDDVSLSSESVNSDESYDFAEDTAGDDADAIIQKVQKQTEQLKASEAKVAQLEAILAKVQEAIFVKEDNLKAEFEQRDVKEEALKKDAASAKMKIAKLEKALSRVEGENFDMHFELMEAEEKVKLGDAVQDKCAEFVEQLYDLEDELNRFKKIINDYGDAIISGHNVDIQAVWDRALTEINRIAHEPFELLESLMENLETLAEKDDGDDGFDDQSDEDSLDRGYSATNAETMAQEVNHLQKTVEFVLADNRKLNLALTKSRESSSFKVTQVDEVKNLQNSLETILEDNRKLAEALARADQGHVNALMGFKNLSMMFAELESRNHELEEEVKQIRDSRI